jgi:hypothetical protein
MKNSKKISSAKLTLSKETLRHLDGNTLGGVAGGRPKSFGGIILPGCEASYSPCPTGAGC